MNKSNSPKTIEKTQEVTLRDLTAPLFRHRKLTLIVFCCVFGASLLVAWIWAANYYVSKMQVVVEQNRTDPAVTAGQSAAIISNKPVTVDQVSSEVALLQGTDMMRTVATNCGLADKSSISDIFLPSDPAKRKAIKVEQAAKTLGKSVKVEVASLSDVIDVKYGKVGEPETPECVLRNLGAAYMEKHVQLQRPAGSTDFFADQTSKYQQSLALSEAKLAGFSKEQGVAAPDVLRGFMAQQAATSEANLYQTQQLIAAEKRRLQDIDEQMKKIPQRSITAETSNSSHMLLEQLQANLLTSELKRTELLTKYDPSYPLVKQIDTQIDQTKLAIAAAQQSKYVDQTTDRDPTFEYLRQDAAKTQADLAANIATVAALTSSIRNLRLETVKLDEKAVRQGALLREAKADETNYLLYMNKREQERTSDALDKRSIANVAIAVPPTVPLVTAYSPMMITVLGLFAAIFLSLASAFAAEYLDPSFRTPDEVAEVLQMPVLASVPRRVA